MREIKKKTDVHVIHGYINWFLAERWHKVRSYRWYRQVTKGVVPLFQPSNPFITHQSPQHHPHKDSDNIMGGNVHLPHCHLLSPPPATWKSGLVMMKDHHIHILTVWSHQNQCIPLKWKCTAVRLNKSTNLKGIITVKYFFVCAGKGDRGWEKLAKDWGTELPKCGIRLPHRMNFKHNTP